MDLTHLLEVMRNLKEMFDVVRLVDTDRMEICNPDADGNLVREGCRCYAMWNRQERCANCISAQACYSNSKQERFEFADGVVYHILSKCVTVNGTRYALEAVTKSNQDTFFEACGKGPFIKTICRMNEKMYEDALTGLKNRRYYEEQRCLLDRADAMALIDIDNFKQINDTYGHPFGDYVLKSIAQVISHTACKTDTVIRFGGDEIYIVFSQMERQNLKNRLTVIRNNVLKIRFPDHPDIHISLSIGGYYRKEDGGDPVAVVDKKMYEAKQAEDHIVL